MCKPSNHGVSRKFYSLPKQKSINLPIVDNPHDGLPDSVFDYLSIHTPFVNVDLLLRNNTGKFLLTMRKDDQFKPGWHIPGSIIRFKESITTRIKKLLKQEFLNISCSDLKLVSVYQFILKSPYSRRGHFISFLYTATSENISESGHGLGEYLDKINGQLFENCPDDIIPVHSTYKPIMENKKFYKTHSNAFVDSMLIFPI